MNPQKQRITGLAWLVVGAITAVILLVAWIANPQLGLALTLALAAVWIAGMFWLFIGERLWESRKALPTLYDMGFLAHDVSDDPVACREGRLPANTRYLQPFAILQTPRTVMRSVRFEVIDSSKAQWLETRARWKLNPGENFIDTSHWLPLHKVDVPDNVLILRVHVADQFMDARRFHWSVDGNDSLGDIEQHQQQLRPPSSDS